ncbi:preprotein translocase subunit SecE [Butyricicoccus sp. Marseille-Q5471]|uniref:preprotein translocase subunit SecE n=1 Tax=Butyricicoccus sp. Marseille-Q5471 TaxID=3039493 RepID=UPI0024BD55C6|nr:preprotein translocase subunit SecE [Butyricicoccus sp. Marseille-Q5471]
MAEETKVKKPSVFSRIGKWFRELKSECRKIVWPTRQQTINNTLVVLASVVIVGIFIWILDAVFNLGVQALLMQFASAA